MCRAGPWPDQLAVQLSVGMALVVFQFARKPAVVLAFGARLPFQLTFCTVTAAPTWDGTPPHIWVMTCPLAKVNETVQPLMLVVLVFVTAISPWKPPCQEPVTL